MDPRHDYEQIPPPRVTRDELAAGLLRLGLGRGDAVAVHASLSSVGQVVGGAEALLDALLAVVGPGGTLLMPRFPTFFDLKGAFDRGRPPPTWTGKLSDCLLSRPGSILSLHPSHAVVARGPLAPVITDGHYRVSPLGVGSPFDRLAQMGGKVLLLGVNQRVNTTIHTGEAHARVAYWGEPRPGRPKGLWLLDELRQKRWVPLSELPGDSYGFLNIEPFLTARRLITVGRIGRARVCLVEGKALIKAVVAFLEQNPGGLLCDRPRCAFCNWARQLLLRGLADQPSADSITTA